jgi:membrane associated rhomboid family serine protease
MHMEWPHLLSNLFGLFVLSRVEKDVGSAWFLVLLATIAAVAVAIEKLVKSQTKIKVPCSIGFSGVLIGLAAWEGLVRQKWETSALLATAGMVIGPSLSNPRASLTGHAFGAIAGIVVAAATTLVISGKKNGIAAPSK